MSLHKSFSGKGGMVRHRNVLTRTERLKKLQEGERWKEGDNVFGLAKVRSIKAKKKAKAPKAAKVEGAEAPALGAIAPAATGAKGKPAASPAPEKEKAKK